LEDDIKRTVLDSDKKTKDIDVLKHEKLQNATLLKDKDLLVDSLRRQVNERTEDLRDSQRETEASLRMKKEQYAE